VEVFPVSILPFPPSASRLDEIAAELRTALTRVKRDVAISQRLLIEARELCRERRQSFDTWCTSKAFGIGKTQIYNIIDGRSSSHVHPVNVSQQKDAEYTLLDLVGYKRMRYYDGVQHGRHTEWMTPKRIFIAMGVRFDLDPASPGADRCHVPADRHFTLADDGLSCSWEDFFTWLNPPFGRRRIFLWTRKFVEHGNGIILVPERTSTRWYQELAVKADLILELNKKIPFLDSGLERQKGSFPIGTHLIAIGERGVTGLLNAHRAGLGLLVKPFFPGDAVA
jgi:hypothetical protein